MGSKQRLMSLGYLRLGFRCVWLGPWVPKTRSLGPKAKLMRLGYSRLGFRSVWLSA